MRHSLSLVLLVAATGCVALRTPAPPVAAPDVAPLPLRVAVCPGAADAAAWLRDVRLFAAVDSLAPDGGAGGAELVLVERTSRYESGWDRGTSAADVAAALTLGLLPKVVTHRAEARAAFRRAAGGAADCGPVPASAPAGDGTLVVRAAQREREVIAFWFVVPGLVAALPGWDFRSGDAPRPRLDATPWLAAELRERRADLLRLAGR